MVCHSLDNDFLGCLEFLEYPILSGILIGEYSKSHQLELLKDPQCAGICSDDWKETIMILLLAM